MNTSESLTSSINTQSISSLDRSLNSTPDHFQGREVSIVPSSLNDKVLLGAYLNFPMTSYTKLIKLSLDEVGSKELTHFILSDGRIPLHIDTQAILKQLDCSDDSLVKERLLEGVYRMIIKKVGHALTGKGTVEFSLNKKYLSNRSLKTTVVSMEGNSTFVSVSWIASSVKKFIEFLRTEESRGVRNFIYLEDISVFRIMSDNAIKYASSVYMFFDRVLFDRIISDMVKHIQANHLISIPTGWAGHAVNIVLGKGLAALTNKGCCPLKQENYDQIIYTSEVLKNKDGSTLKKVLKHLLLGRYSIDDTQLFGTSLTSFLGNFCFLNIKQKQIRFINRELVEILKLTELTALPKVAQKTGNCSYANNKAALQAAAFIQEYTRSKTKNFSEEVCLKKGRVYAQQVFKSFEVFDRFENIKEFLKLETVLQPSEFYRLLSTFTGKLVQNISQEKKSLALRFEEDFQSLQNSDFSSVSPNTFSFQINSLDKYKLLTMYAPTPILAIAKALKEVLEQALVFSNLPLSECIVTRTSAKVLNILKNKANGSFILFRDANCQSSCYLYCIKDKKVAIYFISSELTEHGTLKELKQRYPKIRWPCCGTSLQMSREKIKKTIRDIACNSHIRHSEIALMQLQKELHNKFSCIEISLIKIVSEFLNKETCIFNEKLEILKLKMNCSLKEQKNIDLYFYDEVMDSINALYNSRYLPIKCMQILLQSYHTLDNLSFVSSSLPCCLVEVIKVLEKVRDNLKDEIKQILKKVATKVPTACFKDSLNKQVIEVDNRLQKLQRNILLLPSVEDTLNNAWAFQISVRKRTCCLNEQQFTQYLDLKVEDKLSEFHETIVEMFKEEGIVDILHIKERFGTLSQYFENGFSVIIEKNVLTSS